MRLFFSSFPKGLHGIGGIIRNLCTQPVSYTHLYRSAGYPMARHSKEYREQYRPAYRVVDEHCANVWRFFGSVDQLMRKKETVTVAIDGNSGAGKSSLAAFAESIYNCTVYHMDDYFLPPERKTPERLAQPGGNVDYERFRQEILLGLAGGRCV